MKIKDGSMYILIAAILWSFAGLGAKMMTWNALTIACLRGLIAFVTIMIYRGPKKISFSASTLLTALCLVLTTTLFMSANKLTTSANAIVLQYTSPIFILFLSFLFLKYRPTKTDLVAVVLTLAGISLFFIDQLRTGQWFGDFIALLSGLTFAGVFFANKLPKANPMDAALLGNFLSILLIPALFFDPNFRQFDMTNWVVIILLGVVQLGLAYILFSIGIHKTTAVKSSIIATIEPILNPVWVFLILNELPGLLSIIGGIIVITTIVWYNLSITRRNFKDIKAT